MIQSRKDLNEYLEMDRLALGIQYRRPKFYSDEIWKFEIALRKAEYALNCGHGLAGNIYRIWRKWIYHRRAVQLSYTIPLNVCGKGLSLAHPGTIIINQNAEIGKFCRIQEGVTIGATNGEKSAPQIGDYCFLGSGAKIIGSVKIAAKCTIGANAVVTRDINEEGSTWAGVPAKKISSSNSCINLNPEVQRIMKNE